MALTHYDVLSLAQTASLEEVKAAYRSAMLRYHPDVNDADDAQVITEKLNEAYFILSDRDRRAQYDALYVSQSRNLNKRMQSTDKVTPIAGRQPRFFKTGPLILTVAGIMAFLLGIAFLAHAYYENYSSTLDAGMRDERHREDLGLLVSRCTSPQEARIKKSSHYSGCIVAFHTATNFAFDASLNIQQRQIYRLIADSLVPFIGASARTAEERRESASLTQRGLADLRFLKDHGADTYLRRTAEENYYCFQSATCSIEFPP